jgi:Delta7-sterol 5-desaturase
MSDVRREWNRVPEVPIQVSPLWSWPPRPYAALRWNIDS